MAIANVARKVIFNGVVMGNNIPVDISIENTYKASIDFSLFTIEKYSFTIEKWARRGLNTYLVFFHSFAARDVAQYGFKTEDANGVVSFFEDGTDLVLNADGTYTVGPGAKPLTVVQKLNCIEQGCKDIFTCLGQIGATHQRSMMEYAVWYRETFPTPADYSDFITLMTCHSIEQNEFMAPNVPWKLVKFH